MPLVKALPTDYGFSLTYWRLTQINVDLPTSKVGLVVAGYFSQSAYRSGSDPLTHLSYELDLPESARFSSDPTATLEAVGYATLKALQDFESAVEVD